MRHGVPTTGTPDLPDSLYMRNLFHEFFWGPFADVDALIRAIQRLDVSDPMWDYDPFCVIYGASPLPADFVHGFRHVDESVEERIRAARRNLFPKP